MNLKPTSDAYRVYTALERQPWRPAWVLARDLRLPLGRIRHVVAHLRRTAHIGVRRMEHALPGGTGTEVMSCYAPMALCGGVSEPRPTPGAGDTVHDRICAELYRQPDLTWRELTDRTGFAGGSISGALTSLVADGTLVFRADGPSTPRRYRLAEHAREELREELEWTPQPWRHPYARTQGAA